jgi:XRE family transcriptional regulator, regulator of sulfur utilization
VDDLSTRLAQNLKQLRETRDLSQKALAEQSGVPRPTIAHLESGQANPTLSVALRVARALGIRLDELVELDRAPIKVLSLRNLPAHRLPRLRRVELPMGAGGRDGAAERIVLKTGGRLTFDPQGGQLLLVAERGDFLLVAGSLEVPLPAESAAIVRGAADCVARAPGILYRLG